MSGSRSFWGEDRRLWNKRIQEANEAVDLRAPGALFQYAADLARAHAGALTNAPVRVVAVPERRLRLVKDSAPDETTSHGVSTGAECVVCDDRGCPYCPKVGA